MPDVEPLLRAWIVHHRALAECDGPVLIADQMMCHAEHPLDVHRAGWIIQLPGNAFSLLPGFQRTVKVSDPRQVNVQSAQQPQLPMQIVEGPGELQASREC